MKQMYHFHLHLVVLVNKFSYVHPPCTEPVVCLNVTMYNDPLQQQRQQSLSSKSFSQPRNLPSICEIVYFCIYVIVYFCICIIVYFCICIIVYDRFPSAQVTTCAAATAGWTDSKKLSPSRFSQKGHNILKTQKVTSKNNVPLTCSV